MSKERDYFHKLAKIGKESRARLACPDCGPKRRLTEKWIEDPIVSLSHPDGRKVFPDGRIIYADGTETYSFMGYTGTKEEIDKLKEFQTWWVRFGYE